MNWFADRMGGRIHETREDHFVYDTSSTLLLWCGYSYDKICGMGMETKLCRTNVKVNRKKKKSGSTRGVTFNCKNFQESNDNAMTLSPTKANFVRTCEQIDEKMLLKRMCIYESHLSQKKQRLVIATYESAITRQYACVVLMQPLMGSAEHQWR